MHATDRAKYIQIGVARILCAAVVGGRALVEGFRSESGRATDKHRRVARAEALNYSGLTLDGVADRSKTYWSSRLALRKPAPRSTQRGRFARSNVPRADAEAIPSAYLHMSGCSSQDKKRPSGRLNV